MTVPQIRIAESPQRPDWRQLARRYLANRWVLLAVGAGVIVAGAGLNWSWLVAAGVAPILIALAPCAIMCGLGLCGMKMMGGSCEKQSAPSADAEDAASSRALAGDPAGSKSRLGGASCRQGQAEGLAQTESKTIDQRSNSHA